MNFKKDNLKEFRGRQASKWDKYVSDFADPGDRLSAPETEMSRQTASQFAARMKLLTGFNFHSGYDAVDKVVFVRRRMPDELDMSDEGAAVKPEGEEKPKEYDPDK